MSLSHASSINTNNKTNKRDILEQVTHFIDNLSQVTQSYQSYEQAEKMITDLVNQLEVTLYQQTLKEYDINTEIIQQGGEIYRQVLRTKKKYMSAAGIVEVERSLYRNSARETICPLEDQAGIIEGFWTPTAARLGCYVTAELSPYAGEKLFKEIGRFTPSKSSLGRLSEKLGNCWEADKQLNQKLYQDEASPEGATTLSVSLDGIMIPLNKKRENGYLAVAQETEAQKRKPFYREASCASISFYNKAGERLKTTRFGQMPEAGKTTLKANILESVELILKQNSALNLIKIADGAKDNWTYLSQQLLPNQGIEVLDFYHASEHLSEGINAAYGTKSNQAIVEYKKYRSILKHDEKGASKVINKLRYLSKKSPQNKKIKTELTYFRNNRHRMDYAALAEKKFPIGSGVIEATCKTLVTQRMKCAGMRWDISGGQGVLTARGLVQSGLFKKGWDILAKRYIKEVSLPENIVLLKPRVN